MSKQARPGQLQDSGLRAEHASAARAAGGRGRTSAVSSDPAIAAALASSFLSDLPLEVVDGLCSGAVAVEYPASTMVHRASEAPCAGVVVRGVLRASVTSAIGRQAALWYVGAGDSFGLTTLFHSARTFDLQALTGALLLRFDVRNLAQRARSDCRVAWAVASEVSRRVDRTSDELASAVFGTVRQRVARHLLTLAALPESDCPAVHVTQQTIAESVGTVREVVARALGELRAGGLLQTGRSGIRLRDPQRLREEAVSALG